MAIDGYTKALLHMDGADAAVVFHDVTGKTWTAGGNAQIDTAQSVFSGASGLFDGTGDYIDTPDHADWAVGAGDFTIDVRIRPAAIDQTCFILGQGIETDATQSVLLKLVNDESIEFSVVSGSTYYTAKTAASAYAANTWYHIAGVRYGNTLSLYINGTVAPTTANVTGVTVNDATRKLTLGRPGEYDGLYYNGWIDEFRFSKGIARWTANFTPPGGPYGAGGSPMWWY